MQNLKELMQNNGILGGGGAGFPSYAKLAEGANLLLINGAECEPLLYTDYVILRDEMSLVLSGISKVLESTGIPTALIAIKDHTAKRLGVLDGDKLSDKIYIRRCNDINIHSTNNTDIFLMILIHFTHILSL